MRVIRGYKYDRLIVVDGLAYDLRALSDWAYGYVLRHGSVNAGYDMPGMFFSGSPYGDALIEMAGMARIKGTTPPPDMDIAILPSPKMPNWMVAKTGEPKGFKIFGLDPMWLVQ